MTDRPDLKDPDLYHDRVPYDVFERRRRDDPVYWNQEADGAGFWALTRHADIVEVGRRPDIFRPPTRMAVTACSTRMRLA